MNLEDKIFYIFMTAALTIFVLMIGSLFMAALTTEPIITIIITIVFSFVYKIIYSRIVKSDI